MCPAHGGSPTVILSSGIIRALPVSYECPGTSQQENTGRLVNDSLPSPRSAYLLVNRMGGGRKMKLGNCGGLLHIFYHIESWKWTHHADINSLTIKWKSGFPCGSAGKEPACNAGDLGSIPGLGKSPGERKGYPLQNSMECIVYGVAKSWTYNQMSNQKLGNTISLICGI